MRFNDLTSQRFGRLVAVQPYDNPGGRWRWLCQCDCGQSVVVKAVLLRIGNTRSCGCLRREVIENGTRRKHGEGDWRNGKRTLTYSIWLMMRARCNNPKDKRFHRYGGRGIKICERWDSFENFLADMGPRPDGYSIHRVKKDSDYEPGNCVWLPRSDHGRLHGRPKRQP